MILVSRLTGRPIAEINCIETCNAVDRKHFEVLSVQHWLARYNVLVREAGGIEPSAEAFKAAIDQPEPKGRNYIGA